MNMWVKVLPQQIFLLPEKAKLYTQKIPEECFKVKK